jgi:hypothetical protein
VLTSRLVEQEFVAHLFAPPGRADAVRQLRQLWVACATQLGMTRPLPGLSTDFPADPGLLREGAPAGIEDRAGAAAGIQDRAGGFRAVVRREAGVLNFSLAMSAPSATGKRRRGVAAGTPPGWWEFSRWWGGLTAAGIGALGGAATLYLAKARNATGEDVVAGLPPRDDDAAGWWHHPTMVGDFPLWEVTPRGHRPDRRIVVLAAPGEDDRLRRFTWGTADTALPPLGRYLLHAATLRDLARGREPIRVRGETAAEAGPPHPMALAAEVARGEMARVVPALLPADAALAGRIAALAAEIPAPAPFSPALSPAPSLPAPSRVEQRIGFGIDVVSYSGRSTPAQTAVQHRVAGMVAEVLAGIGLALHDTDHQPAGDGMTVVLPARTQAHEVLAALLHGWHDRVTADNAAHPEDPVRLRLAIGAGPFTEAAIGFSGNTIIEIGRLLDSGVLRAAVTGHPAADLVALVSDRLHADVVGEGYPGLTPEQFEKQWVEVKTYRRDAWLWLGGAGPGR